MANNLEACTIMQTELDRQAVAATTTGWMEANAGKVKYAGGREIKIPAIEMDGLADYDRNTGFAQGTVTLSYETKTMTMERGRQFVLDPNDIDESGAIATMSAVMGEFQRTKVVPEIDAYRYSKLATLAAGNNRAAYGYTPNEDDILRKLQYDIAAVQEVIGTSVPLVVTVSNTVGTILSLSRDIQRTLAVTDFKQGDVALQVQSLDGVHPIIRTGGNLLKTAYVFYDGRSEGQTRGGFAPADNALDVNWIICPRTTPVAISRTDKMRMFDADTYQPMQAYAADYRKYHDLWVASNKLSSLWVNIKQAKPTA